MFNIVTSLVARVIGGGVLGAGLVAALGIPISSVIAATIGAVVSIIAPRLLSRYSVRREV